MAHSMETFKMMLNIHFKQKSEWKMTNLAILTKWPVCIRQEVACEKKKVLIAFGLTVTLFTIFSSWKHPILPWRTHSLLFSYVITHNIWCTQWSGPKWTPVALAKNQLSLDSPYLTPPLSLHIENHGGVTFCKEVTPFIHSNKISYNNKFHYAMMWIDFLMRIISCCFSSLLGLVLWVKPPECMFWSRIITVRIPEVCAGLRFVSGSRQEVEISARPGPAPGWLSNICSGIKFFW